MPILVGPAARESRHPLESFTMLEWIMLLVGSAACGICAVWIGSLLGIPTEPAFSGSLLASGSGIMGIFVAIVAMVVGVFVGSLFTASVQTDAGFFCACLGLAGLAIRSGPMRPVLQYAAGPGIFLNLSVETALLGGIIVGVWFGFTKFFRGSMLLRPAAPVAPNEIANASIDKKLTVLGVQVVVMGLLELILIQSDAMAQGMVGVALSAYLAVLGTYQFMALPEGIWYWAGPSLVGVLAYIAAYFSNSNLGTGETSGWLAALSRVTPLGYVGAGTAGALLAYWCSRRWAQPEPVEQDAIQA